MKIPIKKQNAYIPLLSLFFLIILVLDYQTFYLFPYPSWLRVLKNNRLNFVIGFMGLVLTLCCYQAYSRKNPGLYTRILEYSFLCSAVWLFTVIYSALLYPEQPISLTVGFHATFLYAFLILPCLTLFYLDGSPNKIFWLMNLISFIWYIVLIYQHFAYSNSLRIVFNLQELIASTTRDLVREFGIRLSLKSLGNIMILYNFDIFFNKKKLGIGRMFSLIQLLLGGYCLIIVQQTRGMLLVVVCSIAGIALLGNEKRNKKIIIFSLGLVGMAMLYSSGIISKFLFSFSLNSLNSNRLGTTIRLRAMGYYLERFFKTFLLGNGFTSDYYYFSVQHGPAGDFYYSDVGLIGLLGEIGIGAVAIYIYPLWRVIKTCILAYRKKMRTKYAFLIGMGIYLVLSSATLIITATNLMIAFPIIVAYAEYSYSELKDMSNRGGET